MREATRWESIAGLENKEDVGEDADFERQHSFQRRNIHRDAYVYVQVRRSTSLHQYLALCRKSMVTFNQSPSAA